MKISNCFEGFKYTLNTCELFLNALQLYKGKDIEKIDGDKLLNNILEDMPNNEFIEILNSLTENRYLKNISSLEIVFNHLIRNNINKYRNTIIRTKLYEILDKVTDIDIYKEIISNPNENQYSICLNISKDNDNIKNFPCENISHIKCINERKENSENCPLCKSNINNEKNKNEIKENIDEGLNEKYFRQFLAKLISILLHIGDNYILQNNNIDYFDKLKCFLKNLKNEKLNLSIFKAFFFELFEDNSKTNDNKLKYFDNKINLKNYSLMKLNSKLYKHISNIFDFISELEPNKDIITELFSYLEKINNDYTYNNNNDIICIFTHIYNSKTLLPVFLKYLFAYTKNNHNNKKINLKDSFSDYKNLISFIFINSSTPAYFVIIEEDLEEDSTFMEYFDLIEEIIQIICEIREDMCKSSEQKKIFYDNSCKLLTILYLRKKRNELMIYNQQFQKIFTEYYIFLKENKFVFSKYLIRIYNKNNNEIYNKTILEICAEIIFSISIGLENNLFNKLFIEDNLIKICLYKKEIKDTNLINEGLNKYLKSLKYKKNKKPPLIIIINTLCEYILKNEEKTDKVKNIKEEYLSVFINEIEKDSCDWKKKEKESEELKIILSKNSSDINEKIDSLISFNKGKGFIRQNSNNKIEMDENENQCPLKRNCLLIKNKINKAESIVLKDVDRPINIYNSYFDINTQNTILCLKKDLLLKECSIYFNDLYFYDKNFIHLKKYFNYYYGKNKNIILRNEIDKFNYPVKLKNFSNNKYAYPSIFVKPYTSFYNEDTFEISHPYYHRELIKRPSFPYLVPHYYCLKSIIDNNSNGKVYFNEECEVIMKANIISGNICINEQFIYFINNNDIKKKCKKDKKYLFCSMVDDIKLKDKIIIIKIKDIQEIISRRYMIYL